MRWLTRRLVTVVSALLLCSAWLLATAAPATAGGPTSVILVSPDTGRAAALHTADPRYEQLVEAVRAYHPPAGPTTEPAGVTECTGCEIRLTWLIHDVRVWRIDRVRVTSGDGLWLQSVADETGGDLLERTPVWQRPADPVALTALLGGIGLIGDSGSAETGGGSDTVTGAAAPDRGDPAASGAQLALVAVAAALVGLVGGVLLGRRRRPVDHQPPADRPEGMVLSG